MRMRAVLALLTLFGTTACGVSSQDEPVLITSTPTAEPTPTVTSQPTSSSSTPPPTTAATPTTAGWRIGPPPLILARDGEEG